MTNYLRSHVLFNDFSVFLDLGVESLVFLVEHLELHLLLLGVGQVLCFGFLEVQCVCFVFPLHFVGLLGLLSCQLCSFSGQVLLELDVLCLDGLISLLVLNLCLCEVSIDGFLRASNLLLLLVDDD